MAKRVTGTPARVGLVVRARAYAHGFTGMTANARRLLTASTCLWVGVGIFGVLFNLYLIALGYSVAFIGLLAALSTVGQAAVSLVLGPLLRAWPTRTVMAGATALVTATMAASAIFTQAVPLAVLTLLQGAAFSAAIIPSSPFIMEQATVERRPHLFSAYMASTSLGSMVGALISGLLPAIAGMLSVLRGHVVIQDRLGLLLGAVITAVGVWSLGRITGERVEPDSAGDTPPITESGPVDEDERRRDVLAMMAATACIALSLGLVYPLFNVYFATVHHASTASIGILYAASGMFCTAGAMLGPLAGRWGTLRGLVAFRAQSAPLLLLFWLHPGSAIAFGAYIGRNILGQITGTLENNFTMERVPASLRAAVANWRTFSFNVGWTAGSLVGGAVVARYGFDPVFVASAVLTMAGTFTWYHRFAGRRLPPRFPLRVVEKNDSPSYVIPLEPSLGPHLDPKMEVDSLPRLSCPKPGEPRSDQSSEAVDPLLSDRSSD
ncbi:MAG: MFS transporter [Chloroflexota bacterium]